MSIQLINNAKHNNTKLFRKGGSQIHLQDAGETNFNSNNYHGLNGEINNVNPFNRQKWKQIKFKNEGIHNVNSIFRRTLHSESDANQECDQTQNKQV